jgi:long-chain acyl-CoA synthetase
MSRGKRPGASGPEASAPFDQGEAVAAGTGRAAAGPGPRGAGSWFSSCKQLSTLADDIMNLVEELLDQAAKAPGATAMSFGSRVWTYEQLFEAVLGVAAGLAERGVEPGDRVGVCFGNGPSFVVAYLGVQACGAVVVPQSVLLRPREWAELVSDSGLRLQLAEERFAKLVAEPAAALQVSVLTDSPSDLPLRPLWGRAIRAPLGRRASDLAALPYTAAYDGFYHGAILTHGSLLANARASVDAWQVTSEDRIAAFLPLFHGFGTTTAMLTPLLAGAEIVLLDRFTPADAASVLRSRRPTIVPIVPTMIAQLFAEGLLGQDVTGSVRNFTVGGAALLNELFDKAYSGAGVTLLQGYGLTENSPVVSVNRSAEVNRVGSVGTPLRSVEIAIEQEGALAPPGTIGEVLIRGPSVMAGYHKAPELTERMLRGGWLHTRDLGYLDADGFLYLTGRLLPMAIVGGFNVYPAELERVLLSHPALAAVALAVQPDPVYGEQLMAAVTLKPGAAAAAEDLQSWCRRQFSAYKIPRRFEVRGA